MSGTTISNENHPPLRSSSSQTFTQSCLPMWDSADPSRNPPPLPQNTNPPLNHAASSPRPAPIALPPGSMSPMRLSQSPTRQPQTPSNSMVHRRINSFQTSGSTGVKVKDLSARLEGGASSSTPVPSSPTKAATPGRVFVENSFALFKDHSNNNSTSAKKEVDNESEDPTMSPSPPIFPTLKPIDDVDRFLEDLSIPLSGSAIPSVTIQALSLPSTQAARISSSVNSGDFQILSGQLTNLLSISANLQREMSNLSRRSKDNASDLLSLKEATNSRDEDIRKSLKDLVSNLSFDDAPTPGKGRLAITGGKAGGDIDFSGALFKYKSPDTDRDFAGAAEDILRASQERANSINKGFQQSFDSQNTEKILREMATKDFQRRAQDILEELQSDVSSQGKNISRGLEDVIRNIRTLSINGIPSTDVMVKYGGSSVTDVDKSEDITRGLESLRSLLEKRIQEILAAISRVHVEPVAEGATATTREQAESHEIMEIMLSHVKEIAGGQSHITEELKHTVQSSVNSSEKATVTRLEVISDQINELFESLEELQRNPNEGLLTAPPEPSQDLKALTVAVEDGFLDRKQADDLILHTIRNEIGNINISSQGQEGFSNPGIVDIVIKEIRKINIPQAGGIGQNELETILNEIRKITVSKELVTRNPNEPSMPVIVDAGDKITSALHARTDEIKTAISRVHGEVSGQEKVTEKALEIILREVTKIAPSVQSKVSDIDQRIRASSEVMTTKLTTELKQDLGISFQSNFNGVEKTIQRSMESILNELQTIKEREPIQSKALTKSGENGHCEGTVAAVNAVSAMGRDLKKTVENLQSDVNGQEEVTEKAMEIILREVTTITKAVAGVPDKVLDRILSAGNFQEDLKALITDLQAGIAGREAHTEKALDTILREVENVNIAMSKLPSADKPISLDKESKYTLETILSRSSRTADISASIQELLQTFHTSSTGTTQATYLLLQAVDKAIKDPIIESHDLLKDLREKLGSTTKNTAESIVEIARILSNLRDNINSTIDKSDAVRGSVDTVHKNVENVSGEIKTLSSSVLKRLEEFQTNLSSKNDEDLKTDKAHQTQLIDELKTLISSLKDGFSESVVKSHSESKEVIEKLESNGEQSKEHHAVIQGEVRAIGEALGGLKGEDGELAKVLAAVKDVVLLLSTEEKKHEDAKYDDTELKKIISEVSEEIKTSIEASPTPEKYDDSEVKTKLESLLNHSNHQAKFFTQMTIVEDMQKQLQDTSSKVDTFIESLESQKSLLEANSASERHSAAEAKLELERANSEKSRVEISVTTLKAEESTLSTTVSNLQEEAANLTAKKQHLTAELSSLETALAIRREELLLLESRAETLEKRFVDGVISQSRSLLMAKANADSGKPLKRINNPPQSGTLRGKKSNNGRRILSLNQINNPGIPSGGSYSRAPSIGSNMLLSTTPTSSTISTTTITANISTAPAPLKRSQSVKTGAAEANRRASWKAAGTMGAPMIHEDHDKENEPLESDLVKEVEELVKVDPKDANEVVSISDIDLEVKSMEDELTDEEDKSAALVIVPSPDDSSHKKNYPSSLSASGRMSDVSMCSDQRSGSGGFSDLGLDDD